MQTAEIYQVSDSEAASDNHPHLIVVSVKANEFWVIPGFTDGKHTITEWINSLPKLGFHPHEGHVKINNAVHVKFEAGFTGNMCVWKTAQFFPVARKKLANCKKMGEMDEAGLLLIVESLLNVAKVKPERFNKNLLKALNTLNDELKKPKTPAPTPKETIPAAISSPTSMQSR